MSALLVAEDVAVAFGVIRIGDVGQSDERHAAVVFGDEAEQLAATDIERAHPGQHAEPIATPNAAGPRVLAQAADRKSPT
ncbi:hypothetical protein WME79_11335 [Sorangium sp. So ce726]|uniref:hypothetical protein n=1 Tax=Sorangium sp. So ce726 TaxID=3133319 RepID=UPI003F620C7A